jgi:hypothetical protein
MSNSDAKPICAKAGREQKPPSAWASAMANGWTYQTLIDAKMQITAHCHHSLCNHSQTAVVLKPLLT